MRKQIPAIPSGNEGRKPCLYVELLPVLGVSSWLVMSSTWQDAYLERFYPLTSWRRDGTRDFFALCDQYCSGRIIEIGSGPSNPTSDHLATLGELYGVDIDPDVRSNRALKASCVITGHYPFPDSYFDSCVSDYVGEHIADPVLHFREAHRVLKRGGKYLIRTPNIFHYTALISRLTPHWFHQKISNRLRNREGRDPYPTHYRMNSRRVIKKLAQQEGFEIVYLRMVEKEPSYGMSLKVLFLLFTLYERIVNATPLFNCFRSNIFVVLQKT